MDSSYTGAMANIGQGRLPVSLSETSLRDMGHVFQKWAKQLSTVGTNAGAKVVANEVQKNIQARITPQMEDNLDGNVLRKKDVVVLPASNWKFGYNVHIIGEQKDGAQIPDWMFIEYGTGRMGATAPIKDYRGRYSKKKPSKFIFAQDYKHNSSDRDYWFYWNIRRGGALWISSGIRPYYPVRFGIDKTKAELSKKNSKLNTLVKNVIKSAFKRPW